MKKSKWPPERTAVLLGLVAEGLCRRQIVERMGVGINSITIKLMLMGLDVPLEFERPKMPRASRQTRAHLEHLAQFPRYEDVTSAEAACIARGAPPSAPYRITSYVFTRMSPAGNSSEMCAL